MTALDSLMSLCAKYCFFIVGLVVLTIGIMEYFWHESEK